MLLLGSVEIIIFFLTDFDRQSFVFRPGCTKCTNNVIAQALLNSVGESTWRLIKNGAVAGA